MIDKAFWLKVAENWKKETDGISIPEIGDAEKDVLEIDPEDLEFDKIDDDEIDDILSELGLDDF